MKIIYSEALRQSSDLFALAQQATRVLEEVVGRSFLPIVAEWDRIADSQDRPLIVLRLSDGTEKVMAHLAPTELTDAENLDIRLSRLWDELLEATSRKQLERLFESLGNMSALENARQNQQ